MTSPLLLLTVSHGRLVEREACTMALTENAPVSWPRLLVVWEGCEFATHVASHGGCYYSRSSCDWRCLQGTVFKDGEIEDDKVEGKVKVEASCGQLVHFARFEANCDADDCVLQSWSNMKSGWENTEMLTKQQYCSNTGTPTATRTAPVDYIHIQPSPFHFFFYSKQVLVIFVRVSSHSSLNSLPSTAYRSMHWYDASSNCWTSSLVRDQCSCP
jgi:hypothetical protein